MTKRKIRDATGPQGRLVNRPLSEIIEAVPPENYKLAHWLSVYPDGGHYSPCIHRYAQNEENYSIGYCEGEVSVWLARIDAQTVAEVTLAWRLEILLARVARELEERVTKNLAKGGVTLTK